MPCDKTCPCMSNFVPCDLDLDLRVCVRFQNLRLGFENRSQLRYQLRYTFNIWHTRALGQDLSMHVKMLTPLTLTLTQSLRLGFKFCV